MHCFFDSILHILYMSHMFLTFTALLLKSRVSDIPDSVTAVGA
jgi:hypothetical protein